LPSRNTDGAPAFTTDRIAKCAVRAVALDQGGRATGRITRTARLHLRAVVCRGQSLAIAAAETLVACDARICPCCGWRGLRVRTVAVVETLRTGVICPGCGSFERHRGLAPFDDGSADLAARCAPFTVSLADAADGLTHAVRGRNGIAAGVPVLVLRQ
jgi:hypothetical protein